LQKYSDGGTIVTMPEEVIKMMQTHDWPGNVRELQNMVQRYLTLKRVDFIGFKNVHGERGQKEELSSLSFNATDGALRSSSKSLMEDQVSDLNEMDFSAGLKSLMQRYEKDLIMAALKQHNGNRTRTAKFLKIGLRTLQRKLNE
jgi:DNA-binding NtrC family response regulator